MWNGRTYISKNCQSYSSYSHWRSSHRIKLLTFVALEYRSGSAEGTIWRLRLICELLALLRGDVTGITYVAVMMTVLDVIALASVGLCGVMAHAELHVLARLLIRQGLDQGALNNNFTLAITVSQAGACGLIPSK